MKAYSFGRLIAPHGSTLIQELDPKKQTNDEVIFYTDSSSSQFKYGEITIHLKKICWRKMSLQKSKTGKALVAFWHMGKQRTYIDDIAKIIEGFGTLDKMRLRESATWIPSWLSAYFQDLQFNAIRRQLVFV